jgi:phosphatidate phosphatase PAH1
MTTKMNLLGSLKNKLSNQINDTSGAIDIIVIQNENGLLAATPFYCKFGRVLIPKSTELVVDVKINDQFVSTFRMAFDENGDSAYIQNSFKSILEDKKLDHEGKNHSKSDSSIDYYLKAAKALENAINKIDTEPIESNSSEPFFYIQLSDSEKIHDPITSNDKCVENNTLIKKNYYVDLKSKNTSKLFELTSDQLKCFKLKKGNIHNYILILNALFT